MGKVKAKAKAKASSSKSSSPVSPLRIKVYRQYSYSSLTQAYRAIEENGETIRGAARRFGLPEATLRRRINGKIALEVTKSGVLPIFNLDEESHLVEHLNLMATCGYGYSRSEVIDLANWYAVSLHKRDQDHPLSQTWYSKFMKRWPELKISKNQTVEKLRSETTSKENVTSYFTELLKVLTKYNLINDPQCIYIVDEKGLKYDHMSSSVAATASETDSTSSTTVTIIGCGNASGEQIPPYLVYPGQRMRQELLKGSSPGTGAAVSDSGWSNSKILLDYLDNHFLKYARGRLEDKILLLLFDGHKTHISVPLIDWAKQRNILLFFLPPHTSHLLLPHEFGCFGPFEHIYNHKCHKYMRNHPHTGIDKYAICELACKAYSVALSPSNLQSSFEKTGIYPFDPSVVNDAVVLPSEVLNRSTEEIKVEKDLEATACKRPSVSNDQTESEEQLMDEGADKNGKGYKRNERPVKKEKVVRKRRHIIVREPITEDVIVQKIKEHKVASKTGKRHKSKVKASPKRASNNKKSTLKIQFQPGPSVKSRHSSSDSSDEEINDSEKCCVCNLYRPMELSKTDSLYFTSWGQCMYADCDHWTHLKYCCNVTRLKARDSFYCPCHGIPCVWI